jgi:uncharacterized RDD family membrane protein YckC
LDFSVKKMDKKPIVIIFICMLLGLGIFLALWIFINVMPVVDWATRMQGIGPIGGSPLPILEFLFLNVYFIGMIVFGILTLIVRIIGWKSLKST